MLLRKRCLPEPWYPSDRESVVRMVESWQTNSGGPIHKSRACLAPHAGWQFSGRLAVKAIETLNRSVDTVIVFGGHLGEYSRMMLTGEDACETPLGAFIQNMDFLHKIKQCIPYAYDTVPDNTVEIQLPILRYFFPKAFCLCLRMPASMQSFEYGKQIATITKELGIDACVVASSDLTHYGPSYDYMPEGSGPESLDWVMNVNDAGLLECIQKGNPEEVLDHAQTHRSACSAGAILAAMGFVQDAGEYSAKLLEYATSAAIHPASSFVGYAALAWY